MPCAKLSVFVVREPSGQEMEFYRGRPFGTVGHSVRLPLALNL